LFFIDRQGLKIPVLGGVEIAFSLGNEPQLVIAVGAALDTDRLWDGQGDGYASFVVA
jgi:hypothetical protein